MPDPLQSDSSYNPKVSAPRAPDLAVAARARRQLGKQIVGASAQAGAMIKRVSAKIDQNEYALALAEADTEINAVTDERLSPQGEPIPHSVYEAKLASINEKYSVKVPKSHQKEFEVEMVRKMGNGTTRSLEHAVALQDRKFAQLIEAGANQSLSAIQESPYDWEFISDQYYSTYIENMAAEDSVKLANRNRFKARAANIAVDAAIARGGQTLDDVKSQIEDAQAINGSMNEEQRLALIKKIDTAQQSYVISSLNDTAQSISIIEDAMLLGQDITESIEKTTNELNASIQDFNKNNGSMTDRQRENWMNKYDAQRNYVTAVSQTRKITTAMPQNTPEYALIEIEKTKQESQDALDRGDKNASGIALSKQKALRKSYSQFQEARKDPAQMATIFDAAVKNATRDVINAVTPSIRADAQVRLIDANTAYQKKIGIDDIRYITDSKREHLQKMLNTDNADDLLLSTNNLEMLYGDHYPKIIAEVYPDDGGAVVGLASDLEGRTNYIQGRVRWDDNKVELVKNKTFKSEQEIGDDLRSIVATSGLPETTGKNKSKSIADTVDAAKMIYAQKVAEGMDKDAAQTAALQLVFKDTEYGHGISVSKSVTGVTPQLINRMMTDSDFHNLFTHAMMPYQGKGVVGMTTDARQAYMDSPIFMQSIGDSTKGMPYKMDPQHNRQYIQDPEGNNLTVEYSAFGGINLSIESEEGPIQTQNRLAEAMNAVLLPYGKRSSFKDAPRFPWLSEGTEAKANSLERMIMVRRDYTLEDID